MEAAKLPSNLACFDLAVEVWRGNFCRNWLWHEADSEYFFENGSQDSMCVATCFACRLMKSTKHKSYERKKRGLGIHSMSCLLVFYILLHTKHAKDHFKKSQNKQTSVRTFTCLSLLRLMFQTSNHQTHNPIMLHRLNTKLQCLWGFEPSSQCTVMVKRKHPPLSVLMFYTSFTRSLVNGTCIKPECREKLSTPYDSTACRATFNNNNLK